jgi:PTH1 family peptidyl-tRNA hydrolase
VERPKIVLGLGNPGERYRSTRHNLGFRVVDQLARRHGTSFDLTRELKAWTAEIGGAPGPLVLAKPRTYMNRSGRAGVALCASYDAGPEELFVVYDDADLELGRLRLRSAGGAGGHNGMQSMIDALRSEAIPRLRLGVRGVNREADELADYVLADFENDERPVADALVDLGTEAVEAVLTQGFEPAMNSYNARFVGLADRAQRSEEEG